MACSHLVRPIVNPIGPSCGVVALACVMSRVVSVLEVARHALPMVLLSADNWRKDVTAQYQRVMVTV